jgi:N-acetylglucosaminyldiphosphoundecaprenol N-acetyl-beta-D-mannosaminyltransferase
MRASMTGDSSTRTFERILGVRFLDAPVADALDLLRDGGLMVVPSAPALTLLASDPAYRAALLDSDFAIVDSAYLAVMWFALTRQRLHRVSGLEFVRELLQRKIGAGRGELFLVNPTDEDGEANLKLVQGHGYDIDATHCYTAPLYDPAHIEDDELVRRLEAVRPKYIMLNLGGGVQEPLGLYLKRRLTFTPGIICTGAAIAFLTGRQATIPDWADKAGIGWLLRIAADPRRFFPRYAASARLATLLWQHRRELPPLVIA